MSVPCDSIDHWLLFINSKLLSAEFTVFYCSLTGALFSVWQYAISWTNLVLGNLVRLFTIADSKVLIIIPLMSHNKQYYIFSVTAVMESI